MNKQVIISFASRGRENYNKALERQIIEARKHTDVDYLAYSLDEGNKTVEDVFIKEGFPKDCQPHNVTPYQFKPKLFKEAFDMGYRQILWLDSTIVMAQDPDDIFAVAKLRGVCAFHNLGHDLPKWISEKAAINTKINLNDNPYQIMACVVAFDLDNPIGKRIFDEWLALSDDGESFQNNPSNWPGFIAHRHDQAVLSAILWREKVKLLPYGNLIYEAHLNGNFGDDYYFVNKAI